MKQQIHIFYNQFPIWEIIHPSIKLYSLKNINLKGFVVGVYVGVYRLYNTPTSILNIIGFSKKCYVGNDVSSNINNLINNADSINVLLKESIDMFFSTYQLDMKVVSSSTLSYLIAQIVRNARSWQCFQPWRCMHNLSEYSCGKNSYSEKTIPFFLGMFSGSRHGC